MYLRLQLQKLNTESEKEAHTKKSCNQDNKRSKSLGEKVSFLFYHFGSGLQVYHEDVMIPFCGTVFIQFTKFLPQNLLPNLGHIWEWKVMLSMIVERASIITTDHRSVHRKSWRSFSTMSEGFWGGTLPPPFTHHLTLINVVVIIFLLLVYKFLRTRIVVSTHLRLKHTS